MLKRIFFTGLSLAIFSVCLASTALAVQLTPEQAKIFRQLSPEQKAALAKEYDVDLTGPSEPAQPVETPPIMTPRRMEESAIEEKVQQAGDDLGQTRQRYEDKKSLEKARNGQTGKAYVYDATDILSPKSEEQDALRKAFAAFVAESKPLQVDTDLKQFGYELFAGSPSTFAPATDIPVPAEYVLGPGDELKVQMFGKSDEQLSMVVDREGVIAFPELGPLMVAGMTFAEAKAFIAEQVKEKTIGVSVSVSMGELRSIRIFALGEVASPGSYMVSGLATLSQALFVSGGVKKIGSLRNVQLKRDGRTVATIDLYDFLLKGDTSGDVRLLPGDVVFVPPIGPVVAVAGEVTRPAIYELRNEQTLGQALKLAGGITPTAYRDMALIERIRQKGDRQVLEVSLRQPGLSTPIIDHDTVKVFSVSDFEENPVFLIGNVKRPGKYAWEKGMVLSDLLPSPEVLLPETYLEYGLIEREARDNREPELVRFRLKDLFASSDSSASAANPALHPRDKVFIFHRSHFRQEPLASIQGSVQNPGDYQLKKAMRISDLVLAAGGLLRDADPQWAELYRTRPRSGELTLLKIDLKQALADNPEHNLVLDDLDRLVIHAIWETRPRSQVSVVGSVNRPGDYPLADGMRIADLILAAGNVTENAYLRETEITRYQVISGEKRVSEHLNINLQAALVGDPAENVLLQPYDVVTVRVLSNWRTAEVVNLSGQIKFPGTYPIEEGERLSTVLERAGGYLPKAYLPGAVFQREALKQEQQKQIEDMIKRLEEDLALSEARQRTINDAEIRRREEKNLETAKRVLEQMKELEATGRMVIRLSDLETLRNSPYDLALRNGDSLYIPIKPDAVMVIGQVYNQNAIIYDRHLSRDDYIEKAGGMTRHAEDDRIYVVRASGEVEPQRGWRQQRIRPGDVIVVPEKVERFSLIDSTLDWSRVLMQLGIGVASMKTLNIL